MIDRGILEAFRTTLMKDPSMQEQGLDQIIHTHMPMQHVLPFILIEVEEIWTTMWGGNRSGEMKLKIKTSTFSEGLSSRESLGIADLIRAVIDGKTLQTLQGKYGVVKLLNSVIDIPTTNRPLSVQQYFDVMIRI